MPIKRRPAEAGLVVAHGLYPLGGTPVVLGFLPLRIRDPHRDDGDVIGAATQIGQVHAELAGFGQRQMNERRPHLLIGQLVAQAVAAHDEDVVGLERMRPFDIDLNIGLRTKRPDDHVAGNAGDAIGRHLLATGQFPLQAVVEAELLDGIITNAVGSAIANMADPNPFRPNEAGRRSRAHALEFAVLLSALVDRSVGLGEGPTNGGHWTGAGVLLVGVDDQVRRQFASQLTHGVGAHAVSDEEDVAAFRPDFGRVGREHPVGILVVAATHTDVGERRVIQQFVTKRSRIAHAGRHAVEPKTVPRRQLTMLTNLLARSSVISSRFWHFRPFGVGRRPISSSIFTQGREQDGQLDKQGTAFEPQSQSLAAAQFEAHRVLPSAAERLLRRSRQPFGVVLG